jgi:hypothetical protein
MSPFLRLAFSHPACPLQAAIYLLWWWWWPSVSYHFPMAQPLVQALRQG